jgi:thiol-disulfide isomerase/thioredoxin
MANMENINFVIFTQPTCGPCMKLSPIMKELKEELNLNVEKIDVSTEKGRNHGLKYGVTGHPTMFVVKDDIIIDTIIGVDMASPVEVVKENLKQRLLSYNSK